MTISLNDFKTMLLEIQQILRQLPPFKRIVVGVSGGADSVCLAIALKELGYKIILAHLNHSLRGRESEKDALFVSALAKKLKVPCVIKKTVIPAHGNLEENARKVRYEFLESVRKKTKADYLAVAHQQDDQLETILMHIARGAGLRGLAGMNIRRGRVLRPFLNISKTDILKFLRLKKQPYRTDMSNFDLRLLRNRLRHLIIPYFKKENPYFEEDVLGFSSHAREELVSIIKKAENWLAVNCKGNSFSREHFLFLDYPVKGEVLMRFLGARNIYSKHINRLIRFIETGKTGKKMSIGGITFIIEYGQVHIEKFSRRRRLRKKQITGKNIRWGQWEIRNLSRASLFVRPWNPGDRFQPAGMKGAKKLQDFFVDAKIPRFLRSHIPVIVNARDEILAVGNLRWSQKGKNLKEKVIMSYNVSA